MTFSFEPTNTQGPTLSPNGYEVNPCEIIQNKDFPPELRNNNVKYEPSILGSLSIEDLHNIRQVSKQCLEWVARLGTPQAWDKTLENIQVLKFIIYSWGAPELFRASIQTSLYVNPTYDGSSISQIITLEDRLNNKFNYIECAWKVVIIQALYVQTLLGKDWILEDDQGNEIITDDSGYILERNATYNISHTNTDPSISRHLNNLNKFLRSLHMDATLRNIHDIHKSQLKVLKTLSPEQQEFIQTESTRIFEAYTNMMSRIVHATLSKLRYTFLEYGAGTFNIANDTNSKENIEILLSNSYIKTQQTLFRDFQKMNPPMTKLSFPDPTHLTISIPPWAYLEIEDNNSLVGQVLALMSTHYQGGMDRFFPDTVLPKEVQILHAYNYQLPSTICSLNTLCQLNLYIDHNNPNDNNPNLVHYGESITAKADLERGTYNPIENEYNLEPVITELKCFQEDIMNSLPLTCQINQFILNERQPFNGPPLSTLKDQGRAIWMLTFSQQNRSMSPQLWSHFKALLINRARKREREEDNVSPDPK